MTNQTPTHRAPTAKELVDQRIATAAKRKQRNAAEASQQRAPTAAPSTTPAIRPAASTAVTVTSNQEYRSRYLDEIAPASIVGRLVKFSKDGQFITADDDQPIPADAEFVVLADQTLVGWLKFNGDGEPPDREMGLLYDGFVMPPRETLGDLDQSKWEMGLSNEPQDPWQHFIYLVLQNTATQELFTYTTSSKTGRRAVGNLLRHYDRMRKNYPDELPRVRLASGGFEHKDSRVGWVSVPLFVIIGRTPRDGVATPEPTTSAAYLNDALPESMK